MAEQGKKKSLFGDEDVFTGNDSTVAESNDFKLNKNYAQKFETVKRKQELQKLSNKYGQDAADGSSDEETEDSDAELYDNPKKDLAFADVLYKLRTNDPSIKDRNKRFFDGLDESSDDEGDAMPRSAATKKHTLADEYRRGITQGDAEAHVVVDDEKVHKGLKRGPTDAAQAAQKAAFLQASGAAPEEDSGVFTKKNLTAGGKADGEMDAVRAEIEELAKAKRKKIKKAFTAGAATEQLSENEAFLSNFFATENWVTKEEDAQGAPKNYNLQQVEADEADEAFFDEAEVWEQEYQQQKYRHEEGAEAAHIETFPREQEGLLRQKDSTRKEARERKKEREHAEGTKALEELKRLKHLKKMEIEDQRNLIAEVAGLGSNTTAKKAAKKSSSKPGAKFAESEEEELARMKSKMAAMDLTGDWDESKHAKMMADMFGEEYYGDSDDSISIHSSEMEAEDHELLAATAQFDELDEDEADEDIPVGYFNDLAADDGGLDSLYPSTGSGGAGDAGVAAQKADKKGKVVQALGPNGETVKELKSTLDSKVDEYNKLHYDSILKGGLKTRFRYSDVNREAFGLSDEDILTMDDRTLNVRAPMNCYATYLTKEENLKDRYKSLHRAKNLRTLPAETKTRRYKTDTVVFNPDMDETEGEKIAVETELAAVKIAKATREGGGKRKTGPAVVIGGAKKPAAAVTQQEKLPARASAVVEKTHQQPEVVKKVVTDSKPPTQVKAPRASTESKPQTKQSEVAQQAPTPTQQETVAPVKVQQVKTQAAPVVAKKQSSPQQSPKQAPRFASAPSKHHHDAVPAAAARPVVPLPPTASAIANDQPFPKHHHAGGGGAEQKPAAKITGQKRTRDESDSTNPAEKKHHHQKQDQAKPQHTGGGGDRQLPAFLNPHVSLDGAPAEKKPRLEGAAFRFQQKVDKALRMGLPPPEPRAPPQGGPKKYYGKKDFGNNAPKPKVATEGGGDKEKKPGGYKPRGENKKGKK